MYAMISRLCCAALVVLTLGGCAQFQAGLNKINIFATKYGPIIGKDLIMIGNILVQADCSPGLAAGSSTVANILRIIAPDRNGVNTAVKVLNTNVQVANQLCPLVASIEGTVGPVPAGTPSQVVQ